MKYTTQTGSVYEVKGLLVRRVVRSKESKSERMGGGDWREAENIACYGVGHPLQIVWGFGEDEHSAKALQIGDPEGAMRIRMTVTSPVVSIEDL